MRLNPFMAVIAVLEVGAAAWYCFAHKPLLAVMAVCGAVGAGAMAIA